MKIFSALIFLGTLILSFGIFFDTSPEQGARDMVATSIAAEEAAIAAPERAVKEVLRSLKGLEH